MRTYSQNTGMEFKIEKCAMLIIVSRKRQMKEWIELPNEDKIRTFGEKEGYKYLGILDQTSRDEKIQSKKNTSGEREN